MGDVVVVEWSQLLYFQRGFDGNTPKGVVEFVSVLLAPMCCCFQGTLTT